MEPAAGGMEAAIGHSVGKGGVGKVGMYQNRLAIYRKCLLKIAPWLLVLTWQDLYSGPSPKDELVPTGGHSDPEAYKNLLTLSAFPHHWY